MSLAQALLLTAVVLSGFALYKERSLAAIAVFFLSLILVFQVAR